MNTKPPSSRSDQARQILSQVKVPNRKLLVVIAVCVALAVVLVEISRNIPQTAGTSPLAELLFCFGVVFFAAATIIGAVVLVGIFDMYYTPREFIANLKPELAFWIKGFPVYLGIIVVAFICLASIDLPENSLVELLLGLAVVAAAFALGRLFYKRRQRKGLRYKSFGGTVMFLIYLCLTSAVVVTAAKSVLGVVSNFAA